MGIDPNEEFAGNSSINATIHEILANTPEPSRSRMQKRIRQARNAARKHQTAQTDEHARHIFREFLVGHKLNSNGFELEYDKNIEGKKPDWYDERNSLVLEVLTCERGGTSDTLKRVAAAITGKVTRYRRVITGNALSFVVAVHGDFASLFDAEDCERAIRDGRLFDVHPELSGVIYFAESRSVLIEPPNGPSRSRQLYGYVYFLNPSATRKIDLTAALRSDD